MQDIILVFCTLTSEVRSIAAARHDTRFLDKSEEVPQTLALRVGTLLKRSALQFLVEPFHFKHCGALLTLLTLPGQARLDRKPGCKLRQAVRGRSHHRFEHEDDVAEETELRVIV